MTTKIYTTAAGDTVDAIAYAYYGTLDGRIYEQVYEANPGLADRGPVLPIGVKITLPDISTATTDSGVNLWS